MSVGGHVTLSGFSELMRQLTDAPAEIRDEAKAIVHETTEGAAADLKTAYQQHRVTGTLAARVRASYPVSGALVGVIQSTAPHAHLFEWGTVVRKNARGKNLGRMPKGDVIVGIAQRWRERMEMRLMVLLANRGFLVSRS